ncbi:threonine ammonia-lyase [Amphritea pacifica]|uniref:Threonine/serine dehydratase n=1 Tax=Amphritea pacifica TaxID=2811233 RepID=A0ABS2WDT6_9GAMM|nr:threonine/serine dehydratase [Amphritea pacifica]
MENLKEYPISLHEIYKAKKVVSAYMKPSPLIKYDGLSQLLGCEVYVKHENQNITGSFKIRGGINIMSHLKEAKVNGVVTFSTGNHGLSVATSAKLFDIPSIVVVPVGSNPVKIGLIKSAGAQVIEAGENFDEAAKVVAEINETKGYYYVHPANEPLIVNGVGTEFLEIIEDIPDIDAVILPLGGGSEVASGVSVLKSISPQISIYAVQAELSSAAYQSWCSKKIIASTNQTFAGGFATGTAYDTTFNIYRDKLDGFVLLSEQEILQGIALAAHHTKNLVEGAGGSTIMAAWKLREQLAGKKVVLQFSGSNASPDELVKACELASFRDGKVF